MRSFVMSIARKLMPAALALGALVAAPTLGPAPAQAAPGIVRPAFAVGADAAVTPVQYYGRRHYGPRYYAPPPPRPYYYRRPAYGYRYYGPPPRPYYRPYNRPYYYR